MVFAATTLSAPARHYFHSSHHHHAHRQASSLPPELELSDAPDGFQAVDSADGSLAPAAGSQVSADLKGAGIRLLAMRHGQTQSNADSEALGQPLLFGQSESPLTDKGRQQARDSVPKLLEQLGGDSWLRGALRDPDLLPVVISSDMERAKETASLLKAGLAERAQKIANDGGTVERNLIVESDARLRETSFGAFETRPFSELQSAYPGFVQNWRPEKGTGTDYCHKFPEGESRADVMVRMEELLENCCLRYPGKTIILVSHGETLLSTRALLGKAPVEGGKLQAEVGTIPNATPVWMTDPLSSRPGAAPTPEESLFYDLELRS